LCRPPTSRELDALLPYYERQLAGFRAHPDLAEQFLSQDFVWPASKSNPEVAAALVAVSRVILNTDAFITRE
jgi:hypothetical protein